MTVPAATYQTYQAKGIREDLSNLISDISPEETPFYKLCKKTTSKQSKKEWQLDALDAATSLNANIQGDDTAALTAVATSRAGNYHQIIKKGVNVSGTLQAVDTAGREDEMVYQLDKRMREVKRDLEAALTSANAATAGVAASAPTLAGAESWIASNKATVGQTTANATTPGLATASGYVTTAPTDITQGTLSEAALKNVIYSAWNSGGDPTVIMCGGQMKQKISSTFTGVATRFRDVPSKQQAQIVSGADTYVSDFGVHSVVANRFMRTRTVLVLDPSLWECSALRPFKMEKLAKTGDADKYHIVGEYTLVSRNEAGNGKVTDVDPTL